MESTWGRQGNEWLIARLLYTPRSWSSSHRPTAGGGPFMNTHNNGAATNSHDHAVFNNVSSAADTSGVVHQRYHQRQQVFGSFMVSTKTNTQYNDMNQVLNGIHMNRGNPQRQDGGWWVMDQVEEEEEEREDGINDEEMVMESDSSGGTSDDSQPMEDVSFYLAANTILREAFLQRHRHPDDDLSS